MNFRLKFARFYIPIWIHKKKLKELFFLTAQAFRTEAPPLDGLSRKELLQRYALFTKENAREILSRGENLTIVQDLLFEKAFVMGSSLRKVLRISSSEEFMTAARLLYHLMGIELEYEKNGQIKVTKCYFSHYYSEDVCRLVSSLDSGLLSGLSGDRGSLEYSERITSGNGCCRAEFQLENK